LRTVVAVIVVAQGFLRIAQVCGEVPEPGFETT
jgi:hypothetical protein